MQADPKYAIAAYMCTVTDSHGTYTARCAGKTASCTMGQDAALRSIGRKVFGHDNTLAFEIESRRTVTTWLLCEKPGIERKGK